MKRIIHLTISDCRNERRIFNQVFSAFQWGYRVQIVALKMGSAPVDETIQGVPIHRIVIRNPHGGPRKFLEFNWRAVKVLLNTPASLIHAHDLWVLPAAAIVAHLRKTPLVYDAHEYYRGLLVFQHKRLSGWIWRWVENLLIRRADALITINPFHLRLYRQFFTTKPAIFLYNVPRKDPDLLPLPYSQRPPVIIYQGLFRPGRGLETIIPALAQLPKGELWLVGAGELEPLLKSQAEQYGVSHRVRFWGFQPYYRILELTQQARVGLVLFADDHLNYRYASPNKFFEYIQAGTPVITTDIPSFRYFLRQFPVGDTVAVQDLTTALPKVMQNYIQNHAYGQERHQACMQAREEWHWDNEAYKLKQLYTQLLQR